MGVTIGVTIGVTVGYTPGCGAVGADMKPGFVIGVGAVGAGVTVVMGVGAVGAGVTPEGVGVLGSGAGRFVATCTGSIALDMPLLATRRRRT